MKFFKPKFWDKKQISFYSIILFPISILVLLVNLLKRNAAVKTGFSIPIICVGNIYLGGTGKTPMCIEIFTILKTLKKKPAFVRKKYKTFYDEVNLEEKYGPVFQDKKRANAIHEAIQNKANVVILDDGFQDFSVKKNFSIVCFNGKQQVGNGFTLPSGPLRERTAALNRANCVVINGEKNINFEKQLLEKNKLLKIFYINYIPQNINEFKNKKVICFAGIGNPNNFFDMLKENNVNILEEIEFPDHYIYSQKELENLKQRAKSSNATLLTTEKDYFRIDVNCRDSIKFIKIKIEMENKEEFIVEIKKII